MPVRTLDALALAGLPEPAQLKRIAAIWCREFVDRPPYSQVEISRWVKREFGPLLGSEKRQIAKELADEVRKQLRVRRRRRDRAAVVDPVTTPPGSDIRVRRLLRSRLGPARSWSNESDVDYMDAGFYSGLVAGLVPTTRTVRRIIQPNRLVYRFRWDPPQARYVPFHITTVEDAFIWLIPEEAVEFLREAPGRVEHDGEAQAVRLITQWGTKLLPWRSLPD